MTIANGNETSDRLCWWERPFLDALAHRPVVTHAAAAATVSRETVYRHRRESSRFAAAWDEAVASAIGNLEVKAYDVADDGDGPMLRWILSRRKPAEWGNPDKTPPPADAPDDADVSPADAEPNDLSPVAFAREVLGVDLSDQQVEMLALIHANRRTALAGAHASGKTYAVAIFILWWVWTYTESIALITATKLDQTDRLWNEIRHFWNISPRLRAGLGPTAELLDRTLRITSIATSSGSPPPSASPAATPRPPAPRARTSPPAACWWTSRRPTACSWPPTTRWKAPCRRSTPRW